MSQRVASPCTLLLLMVSSASCASHAALTSHAPSGSNWSALTTVKSSSSVRLELLTGTTLAGRFVRVQADAMIIESDDGPRTVPRAEVARVLLVHRLTAQKARRGFLVGAVAGGLIGGLAPRTDRSSWAIVMAAGWAAVGAAIGASDGFFDRQETLLYIAPAGSVGSASPG